MKRQRQDVEDDILPNWDGYLVDNQEYRLSISDAKKLQGFDENFVLISEQWKLLGNTIPTNFTARVYGQIKYNRKPYNIF